MTIRCIFKNGISFDMKCESFTLTRDGLGNITGYSYKGLTENQPLYIDCDELLACLRVVSDEK